MAAIPQALRTKLDANQALMERLGSQATPNIFFKDDSGRLHSAAHHSVHHALHRSLL